jgi:prepilin signal peptidase PulO-like enzyme (type II secretory pathway)
MVVLFLFVVGLVLGSFVNAYVWRVYQQYLASKDAKKQSKKSKTPPKSESKKATKPLAAEVDLSIVKGRSVCPSCHHQLEPKDLVPVFSWLSLKGKCRYCSKPIGWQYPVVEIVTAALVVISYLAWPYSFDAPGLALLVGWVLVLVGLVALAVYDLKWMILPDVMLRPLYSIWVVTLAIVSIYSYSPDLLLSAAVGLLVVGGFFYLMYSFSDGKWIGGGDVKIGFLLGAIVGGAINGFALIFIASVLGLIVILPFLVLGKATLAQKIPFGPFLIAATVILFLTPPDLIPEFIDSLYW